MSDYIDRIIKEKHQHVAYLKDLFTEMRAAGFSNLRIHDEDLDPLKVEEDGAEAVIREMFQLDDAVYLTANYPRAEDPEQPHTMRLVFILCNSAWESLSDHSIPCEEAYEALTAITDKLEEKYV